MFYLVCSVQSMHISIGKGIPSNDWLCGWCGARAKFNPLTPYAYPKALEQAKEAVYSPLFGDASRVSQSDMDVYSKVLQKTGVTPGSRPRHPSPEIEFTSGVEAMAALSNTMLTHMKKTPYDPSPAHTFTESESQEEMYGVLSNAGYLFLNRSGKFSAYTKPTKMFAPNETVPEPGFTLGYQYTKHPHITHHIVGRMEDETPRGRGQVTYPDYVAFREKITYSIELKTPRERTFKRYLSNHFYEEKIFVDARGSSRSIVEEIEARKKLTPKQIEIVFLFDIRNLEKQDDDVISDLKNSMRLTTRKNWWINNINGVMFYGGQFKKLSKRFTVGQILEGVSMSSTSQQTNIKSFFRKGEGAT